MLPYPEPASPVVSKHAKMKARLSLLSVLLSLVGRAVSFSASPPPPSSSRSSGPGHEGNEGTNRRLRKPTRKESIAFTARVKRARSGRDAIRVLIDIEEEDRCQTDVFQYSAAISKCARDKLVDKALGLLKRMINQGVAPDAAIFCAVIDACAKAGQYKSAISLLNDMEDKFGVEPNVKCFSAAISACEKAAKWEEAVKLLRKMPELGVEPNAFSYNSVISACEKCAEWEKALEFLDEMEEVGIQPNDYSYNSAISACEKAAKWEEAVKLLRTMPKKGVVPDVYSYNSVISACEKCAEWERALEFLDEMAEVGISPNVRSYSAAISACEKGRKADIALSLLAQMKKEGVQPNVVAYSSTISACEKGGTKYTDTALSLFTEMKNAGVNPNDVTYTAITQACVDSNRYLEALELAREAKGKGICRIKISMENGLPKWDLHDLSEAMACMLLADALQSLVHSSNEGTSPDYQDIIIVTGKGLNTWDPNGPVLRAKVPAFLNDVAGLETTAIEGNGGRFLITAASLEKWVASGAYEKFRGIFQED